MITTPSKTLDATISAILALDLTPIKFKATRQEDGYGWSAEHADKMEVAYKRYLILHARHPEMTLAPEQDIDRFWHMHILDTRKYAADCEATFGYFLHHFPYLGLRGEEDAAALQTAFLMKQQLHAEEFGESVTALQPAAAWCSIEPTRASAAWCSIEPTRASAAWCSIDPVSKLSAACSTGCTMRPAERSANQAGMPALQAA
jgi:hypothetical protein